MRKLKGARRITYPAMVVALTAALLVMTRWLPTMRISVLFVVSLIPMMLVCEGAYKETILCVVASTLVCGLLAPDSLQALAYGLFFGWYGLIWRVTLTRPPALRLLLRWLFFALGWTAGLWLVRALLGNLPLWVLWLLGQPAFVAYDFLYGLCVGFYERRLRPILFRGGTGG